MRSTHFSACTHRRNQGFTLVEIMVAMVIGMLGIIIIMQMFALFEGQKRTTTGGDDAQNAGIIALYGMQQNIQQAGYCFSATAPTLTAVGTLRPAMIDVSTLNNSSLRDANTSTILVTFGNDACPPESASGVASAATLNVLAYAVKNGNLMQCDYLANDCATAANWVQLASDIVSMKAECSGQQGIRLVLVTRNPQLEKTVVTTSVPSWSGTSAIDLTGTNVDATATALATQLSASAWQFYRYKTFETLIPIRNTLWTGAQGC